MPTTGVDLATESLSDGLWDELLPLLYSNWDEASKGDDGAPDLDPDRASYERLANLCLLRIYTARLMTPSPQRGRMIGYASYVVAPGLHHRSMTVARHDAFYVMPEHRRGSTATDLLAYADAQLSEEKVDAILQSARLGSPFASMLSRQGYRVIEATYRKDLP